MPSNGGRYCVNHNGFTGFADECPTCIVRADDYDTRQYMKDEANANTIASLRAALAQMTQERDEALSELARVKGDDGR